MKRMIFPSFFSIILVLPLLMHIGGVKIVDSSENRKLKVFPQKPTNINKIQLWFKELDSYLNDNFPPRSPLIKINNSLLFQLNESPVEKIKLGKHGWLFNNYDEAFAQVRGERRLSKPLLIKSIKSINKNNNYFKRRGVKFYFYVAPNKHTIYPEKLPSYVKPGPISNLDIFYKFSKNYPFSMINVKEKLLQYKEQNPEIQLYYQTDTHWNFTGAFVAYETLMEEISKDFPELSIVDRNSLKTKDTKKYFGLLARLGTFPIFFDEGVDVVLPRNKKRIAIKHFGDKRTVVGRKTSIYKNHGIKNGKTLLLIGDSFNGYIAPFFQRTFENVIVTPHNRGKWDTSLLKKYQPDAVVYEILERLMIDGIKDTNFSFAKK